MPSMSSSLPPISSFPTLSTEQKIQILDTLFESSPELHKLMTPVVTHHSFSSYDALIDAVYGRMQALSAPNSPEDKQVLYGILGSHPRLGEKKTSASTTAKEPQESMSNLSRQEQANINAGSAASAAENEERVAKLHALNKEYEEAFPGLRFVTFVNGRGRDTIMEEMRRRIDRHDLEREIDETTQAMCDIAKDRATKLT